MYAALNELLYTVLWGVLYDILYELLIGVGAEGSTEEMVDGAGERACVGIDGGFGDGLRVGLYEYCM